MTVNQLRETLDQLSGLLRAAGAKATTLNDLSEFVETTVPFGDLTLKAFVKLAETGRTPSTPRPPRTTQARQPKTDPEAVKSEVKGLYERAADPSVTEEQMRAACGRLGGLSKDALVRLADSMDLLGMRVKRKDDIVAGITDRLLDRKGAAIRRQLTDRPASSSTAVADEVVTS